ncbi:hypothetical protein GCK72_016547 [Caenorhabditis remanei]|uniref:Uncharacterized protein n=2 Tax=Caenorhabditis remanei TaxID=31234 RepID=E3MTX7_CAERE|nr:hypothetical protein GCK72_016547 [Caenorhabditis remanei]EFP08884.1 hypothetical protein CRE_18041 [Caenorhabditis remanei]KAF1750002.1 hypothetical protein GCK72_016547 [Caenorhabditis remanei]
MPRQRRTGIVYDVREQGTARLIFDERRTKFDGVLDTISGETMLVRGRVTSPDASTSAPATDGSILMDVDVVDGEEGSAFHVTGVKVFVDEQYAAIDSTAIKFEALDRLIGMKAAVEIQQHISPEIAEESKEVFVGKMQIHLLTSHRPSPSIRRESVCAENNDIKILECSDDFLS